MAAWWPGLFLLFAVPALHAQDYDDPALGRQPVVAHTQDFKPLGIRAGAFMLHPGVELAAEWTDNVFYDYVNEEDDTVYHIRPYVTAVSTWSRHSLSVRLAADIGRYSDFGIRDYEDLFFTIDGRFDVIDRNNFTYRFDWMELHEDLNARNAEQGAEPTDYTLIGGALGYNHVFNRLSLGIRGDLRQLDFDDALLPAAHKGRVFRQQGWISAVVLSGGTVVGIWKHEVKKARLTITVEPFAPLSPAVRAGIEGEAARLGG